MSENVSDFDRLNAGCCRALSGNPKAELDYGQPRGEWVGDRLCLTAALPTAEASQDDLERLWGETELLASHRRYHDSRLHQDFRPSDPDRARLFDALEAARLEKAGGQWRAGTRRRMTAWVHHDCHRRGLARLAPDQAAARFEGLWLLAREAFCKTPSPPECRFLQEPYREVWNDFLARISARMGENWHDQALFAEQALACLAAWQAELEADGNAESHSTAESEETTAATDPSTEDLADSQAAQPPESEPAPSETETTIVQPEASSAQTSEPPPQLDFWPEAETDEKQKQAGLYRIYTTQYDRVVQASEMAPLAELRQLRRELDDKVAPYAMLVTRLANQLARRLLAQQKYSWSFDQEEGLLDTARLTRLVSRPGAPLSFKVEKATPFRDTLVSLLIDNSGSMRGRPIALAAMCADILGRTLERCGVKVEIAGFTTDAWKGGQARLRWLEAGRPESPGRLNDLLHIVYKQAGQSYRGARLNLGLMLREGLLKENIDGEALLWAWGRMRARPEVRKILMVVSDGAPVDDTTLSVNGGAYLEDHLRTVIADMEGQQTGPAATELCAIGIGHDVGRYYKRAITIQDANQLAETMVKKLGEMLDLSPRASAGRNRFDPSRRQRGNPGKLGLARRQASERAPAPAHGGRAHAYEL